MYRKILRLHLCFRIVRKGFRSLMTARRRGRVPNGTASDAARTANSKNGKSISSRSRFNKWLIFGGLALVIFAFYVYSSFKQTAARGRAITPFKDAARTANSKNRKSISSRSRFNKWLIFGGLALMIFAFYVYSSFKQTAARGRAITPFKEQMFDASWTSPTRNSDLFWGSYRPGVYFGMKARSHQSPVFGLLWLVQFDQSRTDFRHNCDQDLKLPKYGWVAHDGVSFGYEEIFEKDFALNVSFVKRHDVGIHGGDWTASVSVTPKVKDRPIYVSLFFYVALDGQGEIESIVENDNHLSSIRGYTNELGYFDLVFDRQSNVNYNYLEAYTPSLHLIKEAIQHYASAVTMKNSHPKKGQHFVVLPGSKMAQIRQSSGNAELPLNLIVTQVSGSGAFSMEAAFESASYTNRRGRLSGQKYRENLTEHIDKFHLRFEQTFHLREKGFSDDEVEFAEAVFSNLIGGMGYFYGASAIKTEQYSSPLAYWYTPLYSAVPSRSFFPRGFLWDEGFHQLVVSKWNSSISLDVLGHWMDLMNADGWIPREQILGSEALARVPREFIVQHTSNANPPSFLLTVDSLLNRGKIPADYLSRLYPKITQWITWYNTTQRGPLPLTYQWKGRNGSDERELNPKTLTSGLDDYPRASHPTKEEYHLDLRCWMALTAQVLSKVAKEIYPGDVIVWERWRDTLGDFSELNRLHWSEQLQQYADVGINAPEVALVRPAIKKQHPQEPDPQMVRKVLSSVSTHPVHVPHLGYVSLFPFMMKLIPHESRQLKVLLDQIRNPATLWTPYGIRSLSKKDPLYMKRNTEHDPPYWRGQIWMNMNYMLLRALHHYSQESPTGGPQPHSNQAREIYSELRQNVIGNVMRQYRSSGFVWENYCDVTGKGQGAHPFTGWTSLIVLIMAEDYK